MIDIDAADLLIPVFILLFFKFFRFLLHSSDKKENWEDICSRRDYFSH